MMKTRFIKEILSKPSKLQMKGDGTKTKMESGNKIEMIRKLF